MRSTWRNKGTDPVAAEKQTADYVRALVAELVDSVSVAQMAEDFRAFLAKVLSPRNLHRCITRTALSA